MTQTFLGPINTRRPISTFSRNFKHCTLAVPYQLHHRLIIHISSLLTKLQLSLQTDLLPSTNFPTDTHQRIIH
jgi:hypothetical protein